MKDIEVWKFIAKELELNKRAMLMVVVNSEGSSPGRVGFKMGVSLHGNQYGTIGGGNVEHTLYQESLYMLKNGYKETKIKKQIHNEEGGNESSGMICSGEQTILFYPLFESKLDLIDTIINSLNSYERKTLQFTPDDFIIVEDSLKANDCQFEVISPKEWSYKENIFRLTDITIFGAGHVCLELSETLSKLGFYIRVIDDREDFEIMKVNKYAHEKIVMSYEEVAERIVGDHDSYYVIMTHSHKGDGKVLHQLINKEFKYLGMLGSPPKVKEVYGELEKLGIDKEKLRKVHAPIGVPIKSKTVEEISISIAAELIKVRNEK
ncbi:MAG: XdhC family protein [Bacteroidetes bacterium]|nr:XdhC family protein [Bacteroidota bacterium]